MPYPSLVPLQGQLYPLPGTLTQLFLYPSHLGSQTLPSLQAGSLYGRLKCMLVCNQGTTVARFRISISLQQAPDAPAQYLYYDAPLQPSDTFLENVDIPLNRLDGVWCRSDTGQVSFNLFGEMEVA
jgi:hypothetical protein